MKSDSDSSSSGQKTKPLIDEKEYFNSLKETTFKIGFSQHPSNLRAQSQTFETSGFAVLKGRHWNFFLQKLYCIIGRSPINYKKKNIDLKVVWHVDVDLGHLRKVSR